MTNGYEFLDPPPHGGYQNSYEGVGYCIGVFAAMHEQMAILISELDYAMIEKYFNINSQKEYSRCKEPLSMCIKNNPGIALSDLLSAHFNPNDLLALLKKFNQIDSHLAKLISTNKIDLSVIDKLIEIRNDICHGCLSFPAGKGLEVARAQLNQKGFLKEKEKIKMENLEEFVTSCREIWLMLGKVREEY